MMYSCTSRDCLSGTYEISGRLIFVEQSVQRFLLGTCYILRFPIFHFPLSDFKGKLRRLSRQKRKNSASHKFVYKDQIILLQTSHRTFNFCMHIKMTMFPLLFKNSVLSPNFQFSPFQTHTSHVLLSVPQIIMAYN